NMILEIELPLLRNVEIAYIPKIKQLLQIISESTPFIPNVSKLSERIGMTRNSLLVYLHALHESNITSHLNKASTGIRLLQKPDKIYLDNTNLMYAFSPQNADTGNLRETFFANQLQYLHDIKMSEKGDFFVNNQFTFEIGGKDKTNKQIEGIPDSYIVSDNIEFGYRNKIPLWLFGFLY
ncbi:MAG: AAA family ATPase, partial [Bacteroidales bacterium]|nr:AAA family ATPase [Bacteroidales bacterium]